MSVEKSYRIDRMTSGLAMPIKRSNRRKKAKGDLKNTGYIIKSKYKDRQESPEIKRALSYADMAQFCLTAALDSRSLELEDRPILVECLELIKKGGDMNFNAARLKLEKIGNK